MVYKAWQDLAPTYISILNLDHLPFHTLCSSCTVSFGSSLPQSLCTCSSCSRKTFPSTLCGRASPQRDTPHQADHWTLFQLSVHSLRNTYDLQFFCLLICILSNPPPNVCFMRVEIICILFLLVSPTLIQWVTFTHSRNICETREGKCLSYIVMGEI